MLKRIFTIIGVTSLLLLVGCSSSPAVTNPSSGASVRVVREAKITAAWYVRQMEIDLATELPIVLKLNDGDRVDGYFYVEKGSGIGFRISGNSLIYESKATDAKARGVPSDRFSFTAGKAQGIAYTLTLAGSDNSSQERNASTVFLEVIYPATGSVFVPMGTK